MAKSSTPSLTDLRRAVQISEQIATLEAELASVLGGQGARKGKRKLQATDGGAPETEVTPKLRKKRTMSPEAREKIAAAQRKRWAKQKKASK